jgi:putative ABC transport system permease protein
MRLLLLNHISVARESLRRNRMRTALTTLGITLGVTCMTVIFALSYGATKLVSDQVDALGGNLAVIRPGVDRSPQDLREVVAPLGGTSFAVSSLTEKDFTTVSELDGVDKAAPLMSVDGSVRVNGNDQPINAPIVATTPELATVSDLKVREGQFIDDITNQNTAVIGHQLSVDLFGTDQSIGQVFKVRGQQFTVIGILSPVEDSINYNNFNINNAVIINLTSGKSFNHGIAQIRQINVKAKESGQLPGLVKRMNDLIVTNHNGERDFTILSGSQIAKPTSFLFNTVGIVALVVSAVSLIIGGIGIMNIMLANVAERTREIGIRKAVGASNYHITFQFLIEALVMSVSGGVLGFFLGYAVALLLGTFLPFNPGFTWWVPVASIGTSVLVGILFGIYPALRAARKNPIEALRQYS